MTSSKFKHFSRPFPRDPPPLGLNEQIKDQQVFSPENEQVALAQNKQLSLNQVSQVKSASLPGLKEPNLFQKYVIPRITFSKDAEDSNKLLSRKPMPPENAPRSSSNPEPQISRRLQRSASPNYSIPSRTKFSNHSSPNLSPAPTSFVPTRGRNGSIPPLPSFADVNTGTQLSSTPPSRHASYASEDGSPDPKKLNKRSWLPRGNRSRATSQDAAETHNPTAWIIAGPNKTDYDMQPLFQADKIPELWDEDSDTYVFLFPPQARKGPSFKVASRLISSSPLLIDMAFKSFQQQRREHAKSFDNRSNLSVADTGRSSISREVDTLTTSDGSRKSVQSLGIDLPQEGYLYFPIPQYDANISQEEIFHKEMDRLIAARNLFAFLTQQQLVATRRCSTIFSVFCEIAKLLQELNFSNSDGSTFGEVPLSAFSYYVAEMALADVRVSREKTMEGLILGERMRSMELYNEAFVHGVGKYPVLKDMNSPLFKIMSSTTRNRLERAHIDLESRLKNVKLRLIDFDFPSLFAGIAASSTSSESKFVRFKAWKIHFAAMRSFIMDHYKNDYGAWPPKASKKKNGFGDFGLTRLALQQLYADLCSLYDFLVDRSSLTTRSPDLNHPSTDGDPTAAALRKLLSIYDRSTPPVQPPVPFDLPKIPTLETISPNHAKLSGKAKKEAEMQKLKPHEMCLILAKSHNINPDPPPTILAKSHNIRPGPSLSFLEEFVGFEARGGYYRTAQDLADQRYGHWIFIYVVLQALPLLIVDAPDLKWTTGVEYFLCQPPIGGAPWIGDGPSNQKLWYGVAGGTGVVSLPSDIVKHGVEGTYHRSHCWLIAERWVQELHPSYPQLPDRQASKPEERSYGNDTIRSSPVDAMSLLEPPSNISMLGSDHRPSSRGLERPVPSRSSSGSASSHPSRVPSTGSAADDAPRSRSISKHRSSIGLGLEELPVPHGYDMAARFARRTSRSPSPRYDDWAPPIPTDSVNTPPLPHAQSYASPYGGAEFGPPSSYGSSYDEQPQGEPLAVVTSGQTFDDIFSEISKNESEGENKAGKKNKRSLW